MTTMKTKRRRINIHPTHRMTKWRSTIVTIIATPRFGRLRECKKCGLEQAETGQGYFTNGPLLSPCKAAKGH